MNVYVLNSDADSFRSIYLAGDADWFEFTSRFNGTPMKDSWSGKVLQFKYTRGLLPKGDTPSFDATILVFNAKAVEALADLLEPNGEILPITCEGEPLFLYNVTRLVDALDEENSELERFDDGRIMDIDRHSFYSEKVANEVVFKVPQIALHDIFTTDPFIARVAAAGLRGFTFPLVWTDE